MTAARRSLTVGEHDALGAELSAMRDRLQELHIKLANQHYPFASKVVRATERAQVGVDKLRCALDDIAYREHGEGDASHLYYRGRGTT